MLSATACRPWPSVGSSAWLTASMSVPPRDPPAVLAFGDELIGNRRHAVIGAERGHPLALADLRVERVEQTCRWWRRGACRDPGSPWLRGPNAWPTMSGSRS